MEGVRHEIIIKFDLKILHLYYNIHFQNSTYHFKYIQFIYSLNTMEIAPINFCSKIAFNLRNENYKNKILKELFDRYKIMVTENSCTIYDKMYSRVIVNQFNNPYHILSTNTKGNRYYLYFRRDEFDKNMCLFIDRKICRGYTQPRVIYTNFKVIITAFNFCEFDTIFLSFFNFKNFHFCFAFSFNFFFCFVRY